MMRAENGFKVLAFGLLLWAAAGRAAVPFSLELESDAKARVIYIGEAGAADPKGWTLPAFDDKEWETAKHLNSGWLAPALGLPWWSYATGHSGGNDRMLVRYAFDLPPGLTGLSGTLNLVVDDNAQLFLNGERFHTDDPKAFFTEQPRSFDLSRQLKPCGNVLALRVCSMNASMIGYKFRLSLKGVQGPAVPCGSTPTVTPTRTAVPTAVPTSAPTKAATLRPTLRPTPRPVVLPKAKILPKPTLRPTPKPTLKPSLRPSLMPTAKRTVVLSPTRTPLPGFAGAKATRLATPLPWPCPELKADAAAGAASSAAPGEPRVLARRETLALGDDGEDKLSAAQRQGATKVGCEVRLPFSLDAPARVWAEALRLDGLRLGEVNAAPEVFIDDTYLGPLLAEHEEQWRSPQALQLAAGGHALLLRCGRVADAADLRIEGLRVLSDPLPGEPKPRPAMGLCRCGESPIGKAWPERLQGKALVLSVLSGRTAYSGVLAKLEPGQAWDLRLRLPAKNGKALPLVVRFLPGPGPLCRLVIAPDASMEVPVDALGYTPDAWEPARIELCGGQLSLRIAQAPELRLPWAQARLDLELGAQDLELGLKPAE